MARQLLIVSAFVAALSMVLTAGVKIKTHHDKEFAFRGLKTWAWHPDGAGDVKMALTDSDDPAALKRQLEPTIKSAVETEMGRRGWTFSASGEADLRVFYYLLISASTSTQQMGQFIQAVPEWGLPPIDGATQSFKVVERGSLVIDMSAPAQETVVWRGVAQAEIDRENSQERRHERIRAAIRDMLKKFPPK